MDFYEDYYETEEDKFEEQFQDEFDVLKELEEEELRSVKQTHKRKLEFDYPSKNNEETNSNLSIPEPPPSSKKAKIQDIPPIVKISPTPTANNDLVPKPVKSSEETNSDLSISEPPLSSKKAKIQDIPVAVEKSPKPTANSTVQPRSRVSSDPIIFKSRTFSVDSFPVTGYDGSRVYLRLKKGIEDPIIPKQMGNLLDVPILTLLDQIERERERKLLKDCETVKPFDADNLSNFLLDDELKENDHNQKTEHKLLWVEKFKPRKYTELLSDDGVNRNLLVWLKQWDKIVFGREVSAKMLQRGKQNFQNNKTGFQNQQDKQFETLDELNRPFNKIAMLCGPPGLGKTTLAYIVAKHAGYNVVEMNASDDRSPEIFKKQLEASTQMRAVIGSDPRPNCLIIDEIDGAPAPAINTLVNFIKATRTGKKKTTVLLRPIICICNDLYTASLRPLRQLACVLTFPPTDSIRLATRLMSIAAIENTKTDRNAMLALCQKTYNDIRSCLSTLQFLRNTTNNNIRTRDIQMNNIGQKDINQSIFKVWQCVFQIPRPTKKMPSLELKDCTDRQKIDETSITGRFYKVLNMVQGYGDYEKVTQGVFENYLEMNFKDPLMENIFAGTDAFCDMDLFQKRISQSQIYSIMRYMPYFLVRSHLLFACINPSKLKYPSAWQECRTRQNQITNIVASLTNHVSPMIRSFNNFEGLILQLLPYLPALIQPTLRPINTQLFSEREKAELEQVIKVMLAYNLTYRQERSSDGLYNYILEPNIEEVAQFSGSKPNYSLSYATKNIITRELEMEKMRRSDGTFKEVENKVSEAKKEEKVIPNFQQKLKPKAVLVKETDVKDFFGRKIEKKIEIVDKNHRPEAQQHVWFRFKEGYTNAVRRKVKVKDFL